MTETLLRGDELLNTCENRKKLKIVTIEEAVGLRAALERAAREIIEIIRPSMLVPTE